MITIEKAEKELAELKESLKSVKADIRENGGSKSRYWLFCMDGKISDLEKKIEDLKAGKVRTDEISPEGLELEKRITSLEDSLGKIIESK